MKKTKIVVKTGSKTYPILIGPNLLNKIPVILKKNNFEIKSVNATGSEIEMLVKSIYTKEKRKQQMEKRKQQGYF